MSTQPTLHTLDVKDSLTLDAQMDTADGTLVTNSDAENLDMLGQALKDHYCYPEKLFHISSKEPLSSRAGYFRFGPRAICYGRTSSEALAPRPELAFQDAVSLVSIDNKNLSLPFDLTEIIDNLRLERYANVPGIGSSLKKFFRGLYYHLRPFTNRALRKRIQRFHARNWRKRVFPNWPVDATVENVFETVLLSAMKASGVKEVPFIWFWPKGAVGCLAMTHDVENRAGRDSCADLMSLDDSFDIKAAFGVVPEGRYEVSAGFLESIWSRGFEVTIQDLNHDGRLYDGKQEFLRRAKIINGYGREFGAKGFRAAVLYREPEWYDALEFDFDMSMPNVAHLDPQQGGCCTVFPFFLGELLELPVTTTQDYTLFHVLNERSLDLWKSQIDLVLRKNGLLSFIIHPDYSLEPDTRPIYEDLLRYLLELRKNVPIWSALPSEINAWWRARSRMSVVKEGASWRIVGDGAEHAVLAYAKNVDEKLVYEFSPAMQAQ